MQLLFAVFGNFLGNHFCPKPKDQEVKGQVSTTFLEAPLPSLMSSETISVAVVGKLALFQL